MANGDSVSGSATPQTNVDTVYSVSVYLPFRIVRTVEIYFPSDEYHSNIDSGNVNGNLASYAELAGIFLKTGKWSGWFGGKAQEANKEFSDLFRVRVEALVSDSAKKSQREWRRVLATKNVRQILRRAKDNITSLKAQHLKEKERSETKIPDFWNVEQRRKFGLPELPKSNSEKAILVAQETARFSTLHKESVEKRRMLWAKLKSTRAAYGKNFSSLKRNLVDIFGSQQRRDTIDYLQNLIDDAQKNGSNEAIRVFQEEMRIWINPFATANGALGAIESVARDLRDWVCDAILGAKSPDIADRTKENRRQRGNSKGPPLNETGEFAESLRYRII